MTSQLDQLTEDQAQLAAGRDLANWATMVRRLQVSEVPDGLVVYDPTSDRVHYLDPVSTVVFELCRPGCPREDLPMRVGAAPLTGWNL